MAPSISVYNVEMMNRLRSALYRAALCALHHYPFLYCCLEEGAAPHLVAVAIHISIGYSIVQRDPADGLQ